jgi:antirestriction protein ArdC
MYYANFWVGVVATIVPIYFWLTFKQSQKLSGKRRALRDNFEKEESRYFEY